MASNVAKILPGKMFTPAPGYVSLRSVDGTSITVVAMIGDGANPVPLREQIITVIDRVRRESLTQWDGFRPMAFDLPILLDTWSTDQTIESASQAIDKMAGGHPSGPERPMRIYWDTGGVIPYDHKEQPSLEWWITKVARGDKVIRSHTGNRRRESLVLSLVKYTEDENLEASAQRNWEKKAKSNARAMRAKSHTVVRGETLVKIAKKRLKNSRRWREIAQLNGKRDSTDVRVGEVLNLP